MSQKVLKIGHRGAMGHEPENTLASVKKALELGVHMIEVDVHRSKDGHMMVIHDETLKRTTNGRGYVAKKTLAQLTRLDAGNGERIPTLVDVLDCIDKKAMVNVELKGKRTIRPVLRIIDHFVQEKGWSYDQFILSTMTRSRLKKLVKAKPKVKIGALLGYRPNGFLKFAQKCGAYSVHVRLRHFYPPLVKQAHALGLQVYVWTVNEKDSIERVVKMGADGIFSDYPDRIPV